MNIEFVEKMLEAKKMEREAFLSLLPERTKGHIKTIEKEIKEMVLEEGMQIMLEYVQKHNETEKEKKEENSNASKQSKKQSTKKIDIE